MESGPEKKKKKKEFVSSTEHAERNYQLIENLMGRLEKMEKKADERRRACAEDQNADSTMSSSQVPTLAQDMEEEQEDPLHRRSASMFLRPIEGGGYDVTFRSAAVTEAGKRIEARLDEEYGHVFHQEGKRGSLANQQGAVRRRADHDEKKQERLRIERKLQTNLEHYVTRAVNELYYRLPTDQEGDTDCEHEEKISADGEPGQKNEEKMKKTALFRREHWPIPVRDDEMNPKLLLSYTCEKIVLPSGLSKLKKMAICQTSSRLYLYAFWYAHCRFFQDKSQEEQEHLLKQIATLYVRLLSLEAFRPHRDFFFKYYPPLLAHAVFLGFYYLCPGSRHLYTPSLKKLLYLQITRILTGFDLCPSSILVQRQLLFPEDYDDHHTTNDNNCALVSADSDALPPLPHHVVGNKKNNEAKRALVNEKNSAYSSTVATNSTTTASSASSIANLKQGHSTEEVSVLQNASIESSSLLASRTKINDDPLLQKTKKSLSSSTVFAKHRPLLTFVGARTDLRFRPCPPSKLEAMIPRQRKTAFDTSQVSPLIQEYLKTNPDQRQRSAVARTTPVYWCYTGGTDTYVKTHALSNDNILSAYKEAKHKYKREVSQSRREHIIAMHQLEEEKRHIQEGGPVAIGRYALERVVQHMQPQT